MTTITLNLLLQNKEVTKAYTGLESGCRCGCGGNYFNPGQKGFARAFNKAKKLDPLVKLYNYDDSAELNTALADQQKSEYDGEIHAVGALGPTESWVDISRGNGKTITLYFK